MITRLQRQTLLLFLLIFSLPSAGQVDIELGEVLVERKSMLEGRAIRMESVTGKIVLTHGDLVSFGYSTAGDVIRNLPLVYLDGDPGVNRNVSIAGLDREYQAILVDGKKPAGGEDSRDLKLDRIPVSMIDRIEIDYNSVASETSDGAAGTINIILKKKVDNEGVSVHLASDFHTSAPEPGYKAEAAFEHQFSKAGFTGGLSWSDYGMKKKTELEDTLTGITGTTKEEILTQVFAANLGSVIRTGENSTLDLHGFFSWFNEDELEVSDVKRRKDGTLNIRDTETANDKLRYLATLDVAYNYLRGKNAFSLSVGFASNYEKRHKDQLSEKSDMNEEAKEYEDQDNYSLVSTVSYKRTAIVTGGIESVFNAGANFSFNNRTTDRINATRPEGYLLWDVVDESYTLTENITSLFADLRSNLSERLQLVPALRYEYSAGEYKTLTDIGSHRYRHLTPSFHARYKAGDQNIITAGIAGHISRPAFMSMVPVEKIKIKKDEIEIGNPDLKPARSVSFTLGDIWYFSESSHISLNGYYKYVRDMIELVYEGIDEESGYNVYRYMNIDTARLYGFFIDSRTDLGSVLFKGLSAYVSYSYQGSSVRNPSTGELQRIDNQPAHLLNLKLDWLNTKSRINISLGGHYNSMRVVNPVISSEGIEIPGITEGGYLQLEARVKYYFRKRGSIYLSGDNILAAPVVVTQGPVTESFYPGSIYRIGFNLYFTK
ncbi:MAG: TonB-dependent receptor [Bacteroidia bacterium]|nr:MAG: TonB-dependent receptor [Bacteroidia bacterium]